MRTLTTIMCFAVAAVLVVVKLLLERQQDIDRREGHLQEREAYTMRGMLKLIKLERQVRRDERRAGRAAMKRMRREAADESPESAEEKPVSIPVRAFDAGEEEEA